MLHALMSLKWNEKILGFKHLHAYFFHVDLSVDQFYTTLFNLIKIVFVSTTVGLIELFTLRLFSLIEP